MPLAKETTPTVGDLKENRHLHAARRTRPTTGKPPVHAAFHPWL